MQRWQVASSSENDASFRKEHWQLSALQVHEEDLSRHGEVTASRPGTVH